MYKVYRLKNNCSTEENISNSAEVQIWHGSWSNNLLIVSRLSCPKIISKIPKSKVARFLYKGFSCIAGGQDFGFEVNTNIEKWSSNFSHDLCFFVTACALFGSGMREISCLPTRLEGIFWGFDSVNWAWLGICGWRLQRIGSLKERSSSHRARFKTRVLCIVHLPVYNINEDQLWFTRCKKFATTAWSPRTPLYFWKQHVERGDMSMARTSQKKASFGLGKKLDN